MRLYNKQKEFSNDLKVGDEVMFPLGNVSDRLRDKIYFGQIIRIDKGLFGKTFHVSYIDDSVEEELIEKITVIYNDLIYKATFNKRRY